MRVFKGLNNLPNFTNPVITIGTFDGVHLGHTKIIDRLRKKAIEVHGESVIITFEPHPRLVLSNQKFPIELLNSLEEKIAALGKMNIDNLVVVNFTKEFSELSAQAYVKDFIVDLFDPHTFIIGYDHHFGKDRTGNFKYLESVKQAFGFELEEIPMEEIKHVAVSSTKIREALKEGNIIKANELLGKKYVVEGVVVHGAKRGRLLGFPTANISVEEKHKLIPAMGVYVVKAFIQETQYDGMMNIGVRPTVTDSNKLTLEVHLFNFNENIYDQPIHIEFIERLRDEKFFNNIDELQQQLIADKKMALERSNLK